MNVLRVYVALLWAAALLSLGGARVAAEEPALIPLHVAMSTANYDAAPLYYAQRSGLFARMGLSVTIDRISSGAATAAAVASGTIDIGKATTMGVLAGFAGGVPFTIIAPAAAYDASNPDGQLVVSADSPIRAAKDLEGKTIGTATLLDIDHVATMAYLDQHGGDSRTLHYVEVPLSAVGVAVAQHRIDAAFITEPLLSDAIANLKVRPILPVLSAYAPHFLYSVWFTSSTFAQADPEAIRRFHDAILQAQIYVNGHHIDVAPMVAELSGLPLSEVAHVKLATCGTTLTPADLQPLIDTAAKYKAIAKAFDARTIIYRPGAK